MSRRTGLAAAALLLALTSACARADADDLAATRAEVRAVAEAELPRLVETLDGGVVRADGQFELPGMKDHIRVQYAVDAHLVAERATPDAVAAAFGELGYDVTRYDNGTVVGERDDLRVSAAAGDGEVRLTYRGPELDVPERDRPARRPHEDLDLPASLVVPAPPPAAGEPGSAEEITLVRTQVRAALEEELPRLVEALGVRVVRADGQLTTDETASPVTSGYGVQVHLAGGEPVALDRVAAGLADLGYDVTLDDRAYGQTLTGSRDDLTVDGRLDDRGELRLSYRSRPTTVPESRWPEEGRRAEDLVLPPSVFATDRPLPTVGPG